MLDRALHRIVLIEILKKIYGSPTLAPHLGFKGGTALYIFYNLPRFSVDLDFDLLEGGDKNNVFDEIVKIMQPFGKFREKWEKHHTLFFLLSYSEKLHNMKIEISKRPFLSRYEIKNYLGIPMKVMVREDMFAHKLVALTERKRVAYRDLFDLWFFLENHDDINVELVEKRTGKSFKMYLKECLRFVEKVNNRDILRDMGELVDDRRKEWIKKHLKEELIFLLKLRL